MIRYFDSAYIAKLYLAEPDSGAVRELAANLKAIACCAHGRVEVAYVFHRKLREGAIDRKGLQSDHWSHPAQSTCVPVLAQLPW
jgi:hypothetical protein